MAENKYLARALDELSRTRQDNAARLAQRRRAVLAACPALEALEGRIREEGISCALAGRPSEKLAALGAEKRALLTGAGFSPDALELEYACPLCKDTGQGDGGLCRCVHARMQALRRADILADSPMALSTFDSFSLAYYPDGPDPAHGGLSPRAQMGEILAYCVDYADSFSPKSPSVLMMGRAGLGKTHLALAIAGRVLDRGFDALYVSAQDAFSHVEQENFGGGDGSYMQALLTAQLLVLDDLGTEFLSPYITSELYRLVDSRLVRRRPTIYTTNLASEGVLAARYTEKIASRLLGGCEQLHFFGNDIRLQKQL